jgi:hypothetical protein
MQMGLTPAEDAELRRLNFLNRFGMVTGRFKLRFHELRARDRRTSIREPEEDSTVEVITPEAS